MALSLVRRALTGLLLSSEPGFDDERAETIRTRSRWIWAATLVIWVASFIWFDTAVFPSRLRALWLRGPEIAVGVVAMSWLARPRSLRAVEVMSVLTWSVIATLSAFALLEVPHDKLPAKVASLSLSVLVVCPLASFTWPTTAVVGLITSLALSILKFRGEDTLLTLSLTVVGFAYAALAASAAARDRLKLAAFVAKRSLVEANERLRSEDELRRRLFVNLSHDFRTPLTVIGGEAALLRAASRSPADAAALRRIEGNARSLADLTDQLLELSRIEAGQQVVRARNCDVGAFVRDVAALLEPPGSARRIVTRAASTVVARVDPNHLQRVLLNLVANGLRHGGATVTLRVERRDGRAVVDVIDDGQGIPAERRERIFQRFVTFAAEGSTSSGIGLPLARELAVLNGGSLVLVDGAPRTTFRLELPAVDAEPDGVASSALPPPAADAHATATASGGSRLLLVEDNADMAALLERVLGVDFRTVHVSDVKGALRAFEDERPDAVLSDVMLPDGTGYDVLATVRGRRDFEGVPVILVSALGEVDERVRGLDAGADDYLAKPFANEELRGRVRAAVERARARKRALDLQRDALLMEIHDGVSASLSRAAILLSDPASAPAMAGHAREAVRDGLDEIRAITRLLSPRPSDWGSLTAEIRRGMAEACAAATIALRFETDDTPPDTPVAAAVAHTLRRIAREATTNAVKHSGAHRLTCRLGAVPAWSLRVEDDGRGFPENTQNGHGLGIMKRRVARVGGTVESGNRPGGGAYVAVTLPRG